MGSLVFDLPLFSHLPGFAVMTVVTAAAASALGLVLAALALAAVLFVAVARLLARRWETV